MAQASADDPDAAVRKLERLQREAPLPRTSLLQLGRDLHLDDRDDFRTLAAETGG